MVGTPFALLLSLAKRKETKEHEHIDDYGSVGLSGRSSRYGKPDVQEHEGTRRRTRAVGCTGGAHRSTANSEVLGQHLRAAGHSVNVTHRDIAIEEASWPFRRTV